MISNSLEIRLAFAAGVFCIGGRRCAFPAFV
jgi:hypothetical protein